MNELTHIAFLKDRKPKNNNKNPKRKWIAGGATHTLTFADAQSHLNHMENIYSYIHNCVYRKGA